MSESTKTTEFKLDSLKWIVVAAIVGASVYCNSYYAAESLLYRVIGLLILACVAGWIAAQTSKGSAFVSLCMDARTEIRKVVWPTRTETTHTTMIVVIAVIIVAIILWGLDSSLSWLISLIIG
ncbi:MAG: preprotein translocase subunit SecE [Gammaproteobacteria bacterium]|nr:preprotein translocase subunit SecE [Gammaproteobacteria bacterium]